MTRGVAKQIQTLLLEAGTGSAGRQRSLNDRQLTDSAPNHLGWEFVAVASRHPDRIALTTSTGTCTYAELLAAAFDVRHRLTQSQSFSAGSRVLLLLPNSQEYIAAFYGTLLAGGIVVPLAPKMERRRFQSIRQSTDAGHVITQPKIARAWTEVLGQSSDSADPHAENDVFRPSSAEGAQDGLAAILFTGGSSGSPKGVMLSHRNLIENARSIQQYQGIGAADRPLCVLPFYHAFGNSVLQSHILAGSQLIIDGNTTFPETLIEAIIKHGATSLSGVPDLFRFLLERSSLGTAALPSLSYMAVAGGILPYELAQQVAARIAPRQFFVMYGQTEATARLAYIPPDRISEVGSGCIGRAIPSVELEVVDEAGIQVPAGVVGEIRARGPNIMLGYWRDPALTGEAIRNGWLYTGDLGSTDEAGWIYHRGRRNALIKIAGYRIHPSDVEDFVLQTLPVRQAVVVPFENSDLGIRLALYVRPNPDAASLNESDIVAHCRAELPRHMAPDVIQIVDSFPLNDAMKIDRPQLTTLAAATFMHRRKTA